MKKKERYEEVSSQAMEERGKKGRKQREKERMGKEIRKEESKESMNASITQSFIKGRIQDRSKEATWRGHNEVLRT